MTLAAGLGSVASERIDVEGRSRCRLLPAGIGVLVLVEMLLLQPVVERTVGWGLAGRTAVVAGFVVPLAFAMGCCFPLGMRLVGRQSDRVSAWTWGVNGAAGVMASIGAVMVSMWLGIHANLLMAGILYMLLLFPGADWLPHDPRSESAVLMGVDLEYKFVARVIWP